MRKFAHKRNNKIEKTFLQDLYLHPYLEGAVNILHSRCRGVYTKEDVEDAWYKAYKNYFSDDSWREYYSQFLKATTYERGRKVMDNANFLNYRFKSLWPWEKWYMRKQGEYPLLPNEMPLYWLFLIVFIEQRVSCIDVIKMKDELDRIL